MVLDECLATPADEDADAAIVDGAVGRAGRAAPATRQLQLRDDPRSAPGVLVTNPGQAQFGIVQGGTLSGAADRERRSATVAIGFEAYAIGGLSVGEPVDGDVRRGRATPRRCCRTIGRAT